MYDSGKIIPGLLIFILMITLPIWYNNLIGNVGAAPTKDPNLVPEMIQGAVFPNGQKHLPAEGMRAKHMEVLKGIHVTAQGYNPVKDGQKPTMSCIACHMDMSGKNPLQFCDSCHSYAGVTIPDCWTCHQKP